jgi:hypothetical protein
VYDVGGGKILGTGISGMVRVVRHLQTGNTYAMKTLHLNRIKSKASLADLRNEVRRHHVVYRVVQCVPVGSSIKWVGRVMMIAVVRESIDSPISPSAHCTLIILPDHSPHPKPHPF